MTLSHIYTTGFCSYLYRPPPPWASSNSVSLSPPPPNSPPCVFMPFILKHGCFRSLKTGHRVHGLKLTAEMKLTWTGHPPASASPVMGLLKSHHLILLSRVLILTVCLASYLTLLSAPTPMVSDDHLHHIGIHRQTSVPWPPPCHLSFRSFPFPCPTYSSTPKASKHSSS